jgi:hypothetical protein
MKISMKGIKYFEKFYQGFKFKEIITVGDKPGANIPESVATRELFDVVY